MASTMPTKGRLVTSCLECYRRKQKCDRSRPCNMCTSRGVPDRCHYEKPLHRPKGRAIPHLEKASTAATDDLVKPSLSQELPGEGDIFDYVGYSRVARRDQFPGSGEVGSGDSARHYYGRQTTAVSYVSGYSDLLARLPPEPVVEELIRMYFSNENWSFPVLDEHRFRRIYEDFKSQYRDAPPPETSLRLSPSLAAVPALLFSVLAVALQFIATESHAAQSLGISSTNECDTLSQHYFRSGQEMIYSLRQCKPSTTSIEYHLSTCTWLKNNANGGDAWQCLGSAIRQAQEIDLHKIDEDEIQGDGLSVDESLLRLWECEHRKRLWARLFIMDAHMAMALGRPRTIHREDCSTPPPLDCEYPSRPAQTVPRSTQHDRSPPNTFTPILFWIGLSHKIHDTLSLQASKAHLRDSSLVQSIHQEMTTLLDELTPALRPSYPDTSWDQQMPHLPALRQRILTTANTFLLALHRPYISTHPASRHAAIEAAIAILQTQQRLFEIVIDPQRKLYGHSFYTLDAATFLTRAMLKFPDSGALPPDRALHELRLAATRLSAMKGRNPVAAKGEPILQQCCRILEAGIYSPSSAASGRGVAGGLLTDDMTMFLENLGSNAPTDEAMWDSLGTSESDPAMLGIIPGMETFDRASSRLGLYDDNVSFLQDGGVAW